MVQSDYDDLVEVRADAPKEYRPGQRGSVIGVLKGTKIPTYRKFESDVVYTIEFDDGEALDIDGDFVMPCSNSKVDGKPGGQ